MNAGVNNNNKNNNNGVLPCYEHLEMTEYITTEEVESAYLDCRKNKRNTNGALEYEMNYEVNNYRLWQDLNTMTYEIGKSVCFCVTRPKLREVFCAQFRDRIVHHIIMQKFLAMIDGEMIEDSYNCRKGKGVFHAVNRVQKFIEDVSENYTKEAYILKCDLQGFFMSIDRDVLWSMLETLIRSKYKGNDTDWWLWLIKKVVYNRPELNCDKRGDLSLFDKLEPHKSLFHSDGKGLPIGNLTSQVFANYYLTAFDKWIMQRLGDDERYGRFVDDFIIVSKDKRKLLSLIDESRKWLREHLSVRLHPNKVYLQEAKKGVEFVGTVIKPHRRYTTNRTVGSTFEVVEEYNEGEENPERFVQRLNSYFGFLVHNNSYGIRWRLWLSIKDKSNIYCDRMKKIKIINNNSHFEQHESNGQLIAQWHKHNDYELHQNNYC